MEIENQEISLTSSSEEEINYEAGRKKFEAKYPSIAFLDLTAS